MSSVTPTILAAALAVGLGAEDGPGGNPSDLLVVRSDRFERHDTPIRVDLAADRIGTLLVGSIPSGPPKCIRMQEVRDGCPVGAPITAQVEHSPEDRHAIRLTWILAGTTPSGTERRFRPMRETLGDAPSPWSLSDPSAGAITLKHDDRTVFRYNLKPVSDPKYGPIQQRDAYLHPAYTPSGALITGDFSPYHPHHRGFFLAYTHTQVGTLHPDFWNIHAGSGKIQFAGLTRATAGPVTAVLVGHHDWKAKNGEVVLRERWDLEAFDVPGSPYWLFDLTATQRATDAPLELLPYRYGGMAYRGPEPFVRGRLDVLTSEGLDRRRGDQKPARWVDLTGPVAEGSDRYGGAMILDHPTNLHHPTVARIHPTSLPFFCYVPGHDVKVTIGTEEPLVLRYRVVIHDGHPDAARDERLWHDFAEPPRVSIEQEAR